MLHVSFDWLQINTKQTTPLNTLKLKKIRLEKQNYQTRHFKEIYLGFKGEDEIFSIACSPLSSALNSQLTLLKINNKFLYGRNIENLVIELLKLLKLEFIGFTRVDLCIDFNYFQNGLHPQDFIKRFVAEKYIKKGKTKFQTVGNSDNGLTYDYLKFGSNTSTIRVYLYNKSKEMNDVKLKPYIQENQRLQGLNLNADVWRLEFSISSNNLIFKNNIAENFFKFNSLDLLKNGNSSIVFAVLLSKHFVFFHNENKAVKERNKPLKLFNNYNSCYTAFDSTEKKESNRMDKILLKKLDKLNHEMRGNDYEISLNINDLQQAYINSRGLERFAEYKLTAFTPRETNQSETLTIILKK